MTQHMRRQVLDLRGLSTAVPVMSYFRLIFSKRQARTEVNTHLKQKFAQNTSKLVMNLLKRWVQCMIMHG